MKLPMLLLSFVCGGTLLLQTQSPDIPAFHDASPAARTLPATLTEQQLAAQGLTTPVQVAAYKAAAKIPAVIYQLPCYCYCDRSHGHSSLHTCYESTHGAQCGTCMAEVLYAYEMTKKGWKPKDIRAGIIRGEWKNIDLQHPPVVD
jgi:hypothetical protein